MSWIRKSKVSDQYDAVRHMVDMLARESINAGTPLTNEEQNLLSRECVMPDVLNEKTKVLIHRILERELASGAAELDHPDSFYNCLEWAGDPDYPSIARLTEEVLVEGRATGAFPPPGRLHGWGFAKDRLLLVGCGLALVIAIFVVGWLVSSR